MKKHPVLLVLGNTCVGKSSIGLAIQAQTGANYVSLGDKKRELKVTDYARYLKMTQGNSCKPFIPEEVHRLMLESTSNFPASIFSGYPICIEEYKAFVKNFECVGGLHLVVDQDVLEQRFNSRVVCPICHTPGETGDYCTKHKNTLLIPRNDLTAQVLRERQRLYRTRIAPFITFLESTGITIIKTSNKNKVEHQHNVKTAVKLINPHI